MKVNLMFRNTDFDLNSDLCFGKDTLDADLGLERVLKNMAQGDRNIYTSCNVALFCPLQSVEDIRYRQENLRDAIRNPNAVRRLYEITIETEKKRKSSWHWLSSPYLYSTFLSAIGLIEIYTSMLMELRLVADSALPGFVSEGFRNLLTMFQRELDDSYLAEVRVHLEELKDREGMLVSAATGDYLQGVDYVLRRKTRKGFWWRWRFAPSYSIPPKDNAGAVDLGKRRDRAINEAANALAQASEHLEGFFATLRSELAFYVGCLNLHDLLHDLKMPTCIPNLLDSDSKDRFWKGLYDVSLALVKRVQIVGNDFDAVNKHLYLITGANQGGKSTFLRSIGAAQLMAQSGMLVGAKGFSAPIRSGVFSHFKKEEDSALKSGKLEEELVRMSKLVDNLDDDALMLLNESFSATNEREGSEICREVTRALIDNNIEVFSVTHLYTYAVSFLDDDKAEYLRAERLEDGERTFRIVSGEPLETAFGKDLFDEIFGSTG